MARIEKVTHEQGKP